MLKISCFCHNKKPDIKLLKKTGKNEWKDILKRSGIALIRRKLTIKTV